MSTAQQSQPMRLLWHGPDLIGDHNSAAVLIRKALQAAQEAAKANLARRQLPAPLVLHAVQRCDTVHDDEGEARVCHHRCGSHE